MEHTVEIDKEEAVRLARLAISYVAARTPAGKTEDGGTVADFDRLEAAPEEGPLLERHLNMWADTAAHAVAWCLRRDIRTNGWLKFTLRLPGNFDTSQFTAIDSGIESALTLGVCSEWFKPLLPELAKEYAAQATQNLAQVRLATFRRVRAVRQEAKTYPSNTDRQ